MDHIIEYLEDLPEELQNEIILKIFPQHIKLLDHSLSHFLRNKKRYIIKWNFDIKSLYKSSPGTAISMALKQQKINLVEEFIQNGYPIQQLLEKIKDFTECHPEVRRYFRVKYLKK